MPTYTGKDAIVKIGANTVGKVKSISWNGSVETQEDEYLGEAGAETSVGGEKWEGTITYHHNPDDVGQQEITLGGQKTISILPVGAAVGKRSVDMTVIFTSDPNSLEKNTKAEKAVNFKVQGIPVEGVQ